MSATTKLLESLGNRGYTHAVVAFLDDQGYPLSVATGFTVNAESGAVFLDPVAGETVEPPLGREVNVVFSHIRPQPGVGYDERRYVSLWGILRRADGKLELLTERIQHWDEQEMTFFEFSERGVPQAHRYMERVSRELGRPSGPSSRRGGCSCGQPGSRSSQPRSSRWPWGWRWRRSTTSGTGGWPSSR